MQIEKPTPKQVFQQDLLAEHKKPLNEKEVIIEDNTFEEDLFLSQYFKHWYDLGGEA